MNDLVLSHHTINDPMLATPRPSNGAASPRDLLFVLFWHRRKVIGFFAMAVVLTCLAVLALPSTYRSESTLLVKLGSESMSPDVTSSLGGPVIQPVIQREMQMKTELEVLKSDQIAQAVVRKLGAGRILRMKGSPTSTSDEDPIFKRALLSLQQNLSLEVVPDSDVLSIAYESGDPKLAQDVTAAYDDEYLAHRTEVYANAKSATFLQGEREHSVTKLAAIEDQIRKIKDDAGVGNIEEQRVILQQRIGAMEKDVTDAKTEHLTSLAAVNQLTAQLQVIPPRIITQQTHNQAMNWVDELRKDIAKLHQELTDTRARYMPGSVQVKILEEKLAGSEALLAKSGDTGGENIEAVNPMYQELATRLENARVDVRTSEAKENSLQSELDKADNSLKSVNEVEQKIKTLLRTTNLSEDTLRVIAQAADRATLIAAFQSEKLNNVSMVQPATYPLKPIAPNRLMLLALGMFVAASGAVGLGIAAETLSRSAKRPEDIDRISGLPCVSVPVVESHDYLGKPVTVPPSMLQKLLPNFTEKNGNTTLVTRAAGTAVASTNRGMISNGTDVRPMRRWSPQLLQSAHGIVDGLLFDSILEAKDRHAFVTGIISCRPGQGASTLSAYIASAIADRLEASLPLHPDDQVLLVDSDISEPTQHRLLALNESPGLGDWLAVATEGDSAIDSFVQSTSHSRMSLMSAGRSHGSARLLDRLDRLIEQAAREHRHVVIDLPPVSTTPTALRLAAKCSAVLLVVECGNLHQEVVRRSVRALQAAGANVAGVILNKRRFPIPDWLYERS